MKTQQTKSTKTKKVGLILSTESVNALKTANSWLDSVVCGMVMIVARLYPTLALTRRHMPTTTKNSNN